MDLYSGYINKLIAELSVLPGIGSKSAQRLAFHIINMPKEQVEKLANAMTSARENIRYCNVCYTLTDREVCPICSDTTRNHKQIMVVENTISRPSRGNQSKPRDRTRGHQAHGADKTFADGC